MYILTAFIIGILLYKLKLLDDRKSNNFQKFKNYLKRRQIPKDDLCEQDVWLEKDIRYHLMFMYEEAKNDEGHRRAILDYYKDYRDNEGTKSILVIFTILNAICLLVGQSDHINNLYELFSIILLIILSIILCFRGPEVTLFNNPMVNVNNSPKVRNNYRKTEREIENDILNCKEKYKVQ